MLNVIDEFTHGCLAVRIDRRLTTRWGPINCGKGHSCLVASAECEQTVL
jgi:hypothetical protein